MSQDKQDDDGAVGVVKLTRDQIEICRVLGLTLEQYAREMIEICKVLLTLEQYARAMIMDEQDAENKENHNE
jgi:hypothetical protein